MQENLEIRHIELRDANAFVQAHHRHHPPVVGHRFSLGCFAGNKLVGVAIIGRPVSRHVRYDSTVEITRLCADGTENACSKLLGACVRASKALGYRRIITYILESESGTSLIAANWKYAYTTPGGSWSRKKRPRTDRHPLEPKKMYQYEL